MTTEPSRRTVLIVVGSLLLALLVSISTYVFYTFPWPPDGNATSNAIVAHIMDDDIKRHLSTADESYCVSEGPDCPVVDVFVPQPTCTLRYADKHCLALEMREELLRAPGVMARVINGVSDICSYTRREGLGNRTAWDVACDEPMQGWTPVQHIKNTICVVSVTDRGEIAAVYAIRRRTIVWDGWCQKLARLNHTQLSLSAD